MTGKLSISLKDLLRNGNISFHNYLEQKISKKWIKTNVLISNGLIYMFTEMDFEKPKMVEALKEFNHLSLMKDRKKQPLYTLTLKSNSKKNNIQELVFGENNEDKISLLVKILNENIIMNSQHNSLRLSNNSQEISGKSPENIENVYESTDNVSHSPQSLPKSLTEIPEPEYQGLETSSITETSTVTDLSIYVGISQNEENYLFRGTSAEAYSELQKNIVHESFLVRQDLDNRQVLTVQCRNVVLKYNLDIDPQTNKINIRNQNEKFFNLESLINYYRENNIPGYNCILKIPYKLR